MARPSLPHLPELGQLAELPQRLGRRLAEFQAEHRGQAPAAAPGPSAVVVGGGVAGLVAARELALTGHAVTVVEAGVLGGHVGTHEVDALRLDSGAESFATRSDAVAKLAGELGLEVTYPAATPAWLHAGPGRDVPLPRTGLLGIPADPFETEVVAALGEAGAARAAQDLDAPVDPALFGEGVTLGALVRSRLGAAALHALVTPVVSGVHSADPDALEADAVAPGLRAALRREGSLCRAAASLRAAAPAGSAVAGLVGGMGTLVDALRDDLAARGVRSHEHTRVSALERVEREDGARGWVVRAAGTAKQGTSFEAWADRLVVATEGPTAVDLLADSVPGLGELRPAEGAGVSLVTLVVDLPELDGAPRGTGILVAPDAGDVVAKALTHASAKWPLLGKEAGPGRHVLRLSYGRLTDEAARMADADDATLVSQGVADAAALLGVDLGEADVLGADVVRHAGALPMATPGHRALLRSVAELVDGTEGLDVVGAWRSGTGLAAVVGSTRARLGISAA